MKTSYKIGDIMTEEPVTISPKTTIQECARIMEEKHVGSLIIKEDRLLGIITEQDIVRKAIALGIEPKTTPVREIMEKNLFMVGPEADIYDALVLMNEKNIRHLPVVSNKRMVGFLTIKDILKVQPQLFDLVVEKFELREQERKLRSIDSGF